MKNTLEQLVEDFEAKIKQRAIVKDEKSLLGSDLDSYRRGVSETVRILEPILEAVLKMEDHRLIGHAEPDAYTKLGCLTNVATEAIAESKKRLQEQYHRDLAAYRAEAFERAARERMKEPWGAGNPAHSTKDANERLKWWTREGVMDVSAYEVLGWTPLELERFHETREVPKGYEP